MTLTNKQSAETTGAEEVQVDYPRRRLGSTERCTVEHGDRGRSVELQATESSTVSRCARKSSDVDSTT